MKKIIYFGVIFITIYLHIMYEWPLGLKILSAEFVFPIICVCFAACIRRKISTKIIMKKDVAEQGEELPVKIEVRNDSVFPVFVKVMFCHQYMAEEKQQKSSYNVYLESKTSTDIDVKMTAECCGKMQLTIPKLKIFDFCGIFSLPQKTQEKQNIVVIPKPYPVTLVVSNRTKWFPIDGESYAQDRSGDDSAEIYEVREYRAGDRLQKVHWKLSAKEDSLYIKEFSYPIGAAVIILLEGSNPDTKKKAAGTCFIEAVVSVSMALVEKDCAHYVIWKNKKDQEIQRVLIRDEEGFYGFLLSFLEFENDCLETDIEEYYHYQYKNENYSTLLKISTELVMTINRQEHMDMQKQGLKTFFETVEIVV